MPTWGGEEPVPTWRRGGACAHLGEGRSLCPPGGGEEPVQDHTCEAQPDPHTHTLGFLATLIGLAARRSFYFSPLAK